MKTSIKPSFNISRINLTADDVEQFFSKKLPEIFEFFGTSKEQTGELKIVLCHNAEMFAQYYYGTKKSLSTEKVLEAYYDCQAFFDDTTNAMILPVFSRVGTDKFESKESISLSVESCIHEAIHFIQYNTGGYSESYLFDEGITELLSYALCGGVDPQNGHDYFTYVTYLLEVFFELKKEKDEIIDWCKKYTTSEEKEIMSNELLKSFIASRKLDIDINHLHEQLQDEDMPDDFFVDYDETKFVNFLYELFEEHSIL
jgi:hypothetical protein